MLAKTESIESFLSQLGVDFIKDYDLKRFSYFKTGFVCPFLIKPKNEDQCREVLRFLKEKSYSFKIIGGTSNILFRDDSFLDVLLSLQNFNQFEYDSYNNVLEVGAGMRLPGLARKTAKLGLAGFEGLEGIPATLGGAIFMNAEAYGYETSNNLLSVKVISPEGELKEYKRAELNFSYRKSRFHDENLGVIISARFSMIIKDSPEKIMETLNYVNEDRRKYQEHKLPNLGSLFATKDLYLEFAKTDFIYWKIFQFVRWINKKRMPVDNKLLNKLTCLRFGLKFNIQPFSDKTMNCIVKREGLNSSDFLDYIEKVKKITNNNVKIENEII